VKFKKSEPERMHAVKRVFLKCNLKLATLYITGISVGFDASVRNSLGQVSVKVTDVVTSIAKRFFPGLSTSAEMICFAGGYINTSTFVVF
jgi:hypothetical protein